MKFKFFLLPIILLLLNANAVELENFHKDFIKNTKDKIKENNGKIKVDDNLYLIDINGIRNSISYTYTLDTSLTVSRFKEQAPDLTNEEILNYLNDTTMEKKQLKNYFYKKFKNNYCLNETRKQLLNLEIMFNFQFMFDETVSLFYFDIDKNSCYEKD